LPKHLASRLRFDGDVLRVRACKDGAMIKSSENRMQKAAIGFNRRPATQDDIKSILGDLDETKMLPILALRPSVADVEEASIWLGGDPDVFGAVEPLKGIASQIVTILTVEEEEESPRVG